MNVRHVVAHSVPRNDGVTRSWAEETAEHVDGRAMGGVGGEGRGEEGATVVPSVVWMGERDD